MRRDWVAAWGGRAPPPPEINWRAWWKQAKNQFGELLSAAQAEPPPRRPLSMLPQWIEKNAPEIKQLNVSSPKLHTPGGHFFRDLEATVQGPDGDEEHGHRVCYSPRPPGESDDILVKLRDAKQRKREERAVLSLAARPRRIALRRQLEYEQETAADLKKEQYQVRSCCRMLEKLSLTPQIIIGTDGSEAWCRGAVGLDEQALGMWFALLEEPVEKQRHLERGCFLCRNVSER